MQASSFVRAAVFLVCGAIHLAAQQGTDKAFSADALRFFENEVRPLLSTKCAACHNDKLLTSGLSVESRESILMGGNRGQAAFPGSPEDSLLIHATRQSDELKMPPGGKLAPEELAALARWVELGLPWPTAMSVRTDPRTIRRRIGLFNRFAVPARRRFPRRRGCVIRSTVSSWRVSRTKVCRPHRKPSGPP